MTFPAARNTLSEARKSAGLPGLESLVEFALGDGDGHAGVAVGVLGFADGRGRRAFVFGLGGGGWFGAFEPGEHCCWREANVGVGWCGESGLLSEGVVGGVVVGNGCEGRLCCQVLYVSFVGESSWEWLD